MIYLFYAFKLKPNLLILLLICLEYADNLWFSANASNYIKKFI
jgi:hypothetical protein